MCAELRNDLYYIHVFIVFHWNHYEYSVDFFFHLILWNCISIKDIRRLTQTPSRWCMDASLLHILLSLHTIFAPARCKPMRKMWNFRRDRDSRVSLVNSSDCITFNGKVIHYKLSLNPYQCCKRCQRIMNGCTLLPKLDGMRLHMHVWAHARAHLRHKKQTQSPVGSSHRRHATLVYVKWGIFGTNFQFKVEVYFLLFLTHEWVS